MKRIIKLVSLLIVVSLLTGCFGNFALTKKVYQWNDNVSDNKFVEQILFWGMTILPVYEVAGFIDVCFLNLIEFWTGSNPLAYNDLDGQTIEIDGLEYKIEVTENSLKAVQMGTDASFELVYNQETSNLELKSNNETKVIGTYSDNTLNLVKPDGSIKVINM